MTGWWPLFILHLDHGEIQKQWLICHVGICTNSAHVKQDVAASLINDSNHCVESDMNQHSRLFCGKNTTYEWKNTINYANGQVQMSSKASSVWMFCYNTNTNGQVKKYCGYKCDDFVIIMIHINKVNIK